VAAQADELTIAVASNFVSPLSAIAVEFEQATSHETIIVSGSTGQLYAQIVNGAPYDILLAADAERPRSLAEAGRGEPASVFTYALGHLALWSVQPSLVDDTTLGSLADSSFRWFAIAEPRVAPYGLAAQQTLESLGVWESLEERLVRPQNVAQTFAMIQTGNAELGLVALSQALAYQGPASFRRVPDELHAPIAQDAVLLTAAASKPAAAQFLAYLQGWEAISIITEFGYSVPSNPD
jgi:molybdate transport system substrate-binding protein